MSPILDETHLCELYLAGHRAPAGNYREQNSGRMVQLEREDTLPASLNGRVACYMRVTTFGALFSSPRQAA